MTTNMMNSVKSLALALVASGVMLGIAAGPAAAGTVAGGGREARIEVSKFDLTRAEGRKAVESRVAAMAGRMCAEGGVNLTDRAEAAEYRLCVADAVASARTQIAAILSQQALASR
ncbi:UrcA family protein [Sandaracinobacter neustonicus]|uniref:UrcA family protein n=1 Tax=Sandaracinobacter neustonicus TaxID=1715348 RepID=A0A501XSI9_9SPHN|nr:UrcA family protein [Sandaracinobacter neustonicus]TPE63313.1 UrcA family protein [Sandaracinobacter neustonicus]